MTARAICYFNLDPLWAHPEIGAIGIDNYMPLERLARWRPRGGNPDGARFANDSAAFGAAIAGGEGFDWYYADKPGRDARDRLPITDGLAGKDWVYRIKDLRGWWQNQHFDRIGGVEAGTPSPWVPGSKPFWFTELGCPAVDKGPNQPNLFPDPKSSESAIPWYSSGGRDDLAQRAFLEAHLDHWSGAANADGMVKPTTSTSGPGMRGRSRRFRCQARSGRTGPTGAPATGSTDGWERWRSRI
jgi:hypothetical protein